MYYKERGFLTWDLVTSLIISSLFLTIFLQIFKIVYASYINFNNFQKEYTEYKFISTLLKNHINSSCELMQISKNQICFKKRFLENDYLVEKTYNLLKKNSFLIFEVYNQYGEKTEIRLGEKIQNINFNKNENIVEIKLIYKGFSQEIWINFKCDENG